MESEELRKYFEETRSRLSFYIKHEAKRKFVGESYNYIIKIPILIFWIVTLVTTFIVFTVELIVAGVLWNLAPVIYGDLLLGFSIAVIFGLLVGQLFRSKASKKIHDQIAEILKFKKFNEEENSNS